MLVTEEVSQFPIYWLNDLASENIQFIVVTDEVFQSPMGWLNDSARRNMEFIFVTQNIADIPPGYILVEGGLVLEGLVHTGHTRLLPVLDVAVGGGGCGLIGKPEIPSGEEVGIIQRRVLCPQRRSSNQPKQNPCKDRLEEGGRTG